MEEEKFEKVIAEREDSSRHDPATVPLPPYFPDTPIVRRDVARYYDLVTEMDRQAKVILDELEEDGLSSNTIVFYFSDHGWGLPRGKRWPYDSGLHVPLMVRYPGVIEAGAVRDDLVSFVDFAPTVLQLARVPVPGHMQGKAFLGEPGEAREYVFGARDRMIEAEDMIRTVRDAQFLYIRNFQPEKPYAQTIEYMEKVPTMQEWRRMHAEGKLNEVQQLFFRETKPKEELYDCTADPHQVNDLAANPEYGEDLKRLRAALERWRTETKDLGDVPERELQRRMYPDGETTKTAAPKIWVKRTADESRLEMRSATAGASLTYRTETPGGISRWLLYSGPVPIDEPTTVTAKAIRLGWEESSVVKRTVAP